jgi:hypothetical protein
MTSAAFSDERIRRRLMIGLVLYELALVTVILSTGVTIALSQGGTLQAAAPLTVIALAEATRVWLAGYAVRLGWVGRAIAFVALAAIALASFEGLVLVFQIFTDNRLVHVTQAEANVDRAQRAVAAIEHTQTLADAEIEQRAREVNDAERQIKDVSDQMPKAAPAAGTCSDKRGRRVSCGADTANATTLQHAMADYDARLSLAMKAREAALRNLDAAHAKAGAIDATPAKNQLSDAKEALAQELMSSPFPRAVTTIFAVPVADLTEAELQRVRRMVVLGLAATFATLSMMASLVVHLQPKDAKPSKLARAIRAMVASRRKRLRRIEPTIEYRYRDRVLHVPVDTLGRVLDPDKAKP